MKQFKNMKGIALGLLSLAMLGCDSAPLESVQGDKEASSAAAREGIDQAALVDQWLEKLTLEQKADLVSGAGWSTSGIDPQYDRVAGAVGYTMGYPELGLRSIVLADGPAGLRISPTREGDENTYYATAFPVATALASTWNVDLVEQVGAAMGEEVRDYGVDIFLAPGMNIQRNPLAGRNFEYYSEDPVLSGYLAAAAVNGVQSNGVGATIKHYVANNQETNRLAVDTLVNERALREIYLRGFEIAIERSNPWTMMSSYNKVNGDYTSEDSELLTTVLRDEWGYQGLVMTDWFAGLDAVAQLKAGNDLLMPGVAERTAEVKQSLESGALSEAELDVNVKRILELVARSRSQSDYAFSNKPDLKAHAEVARKAAAEGVVLLKNEGGVLPLLSDTRNVALFGNTSYDFIAGGTGSGDVNEAYTISLEQGLSAAGFEIDHAVRQHYLDYRAEHEAGQPEKRNFWELVELIPEMPLSSDLLVEAADRAQAALITLGRTSGEFSDLNREKDFELSAAEKVMLEAVSKAFRAQGKPVVVILNIGNVIETVSWRDLADAIVLPWQGGQEAGHAAADVLTGSVNPSGKLPTTFPVRYEDVPSATSFPGIDLPGEEISIAGILKAKPSEVEYRDGLFVGYRYYDSFAVEPAFPFGFGLSYTTFDMSAGAPVATEAGYQMTISVTNTGTVAGKQVVQLYVAAPASHLVKPAKELRRFAKTGVIQPGESEQLTVELNHRDFSSFDPQARAWVAEAGDYQILVGSSSRDIHHTAEVTLSESVRVQEVIADLREARVVEELAPAPAR